MRKRISFFLLPVTTQISQHHLYFILSVSTQMAVDECFYSRLSFQFIYMYVYANVRLLDCYNFVEYFEVKCYDACRLVLLLLKRPFLFIALVIPYNPKICISSTKLEQNVSKSHIWVASSCSGSYDLLSRSW